MHEPINVKPLEYLIKKPPVHTKRLTITLMKLKSCNSSLRMLLLRISVYVKLVLQYKLFILDTYHPDLYSYVSKDVSIRHFLRSQKGSTSEIVWETLIYNFHIHALHLDIIKVFYSPNDAQVNCLKNNIKIYIKTAPDTNRCILTLRRLMSYTYGAPILDVSISHTTTQHSR